MSVSVLSSSADCADDAESPDPGRAAGEAGWSERLAVRVHGEVRDQHVYSAWPFYSCRRAESAAA